MDTYEDTEMFSCVDINTFGTGRDAVLEGDISESPALFGAVDQPLETMNFTASTKPTLFLEKKRKDPDPSLGDQSPALFGAVDQPLETMNFTASTKPTLFLEKKRKDLDPSLGDQDRRPVKKYCIEDGYHDSEPGIRLLYVFNYDIFKNSEYEERKGSEKDKNNLVSTFSKLGFVCKSFLNLIKKDTLGELKAIQELCNNEPIKMINIAFMSHGDGTGTDSFVTSDVESVSMDSVLDMFSNRNCTGMKGKPKIFWANFCRNIRQHTEIPVNPSLTNEPDQQSLPTGESGCDQDVEKFLQYAKLNPTLLKNHSDLFHYNSSEMETDSKDSSNSASTFGLDDWEDMTIIYSSRPKKESYRDRNHGTVMVQCLCDVLDQDGQTLPLRELYYALEIKMKAWRSGDISQYKSSPDIDEHSTKPCFLTDHLS